MKNYIIVIGALLCLLCKPCSLQAQDSMHVSQINWSGLAQDTTLTFAQIVHICDSMFAICGYPKTDTTELSDSVDEEEGSPYRTYTHWKQFWEVRLDETTGRMHDFSNKVMQRIIAGTNYNDCYRESDIQSNLGTVIPGGLGWHWIGPQNIQGASNTLGQSLGRVNIIKINPYNTNEVYITNEYGGIWKTNNANAHPNCTWTCITDAYANRQIDGLGVISMDAEFSSSGGPTKLCIIFGSPNRNFLYFFAKQFRPVGVFYSFDGGSTIHPIQIPTSLIPDLREEQFRQIAFWPGNSLSTDKFIFFTTKYKVLRLKMNGASGIGAFAPSYPAEIYPLTDVYSSLPHDGTDSKRFPGFKGVAFRKSDPSEMWITSESNMGNIYTTGAYLFKILNCKTCTSCTPINVTGQLQFSLSNYIKNYKFTTSPLGHYQWVNDASWTYNTSLRRMECSTNNIFGDAIETAIIGSNIPGIPTEGTCDLSFTLGPNMGYELYLIDNNVLGEYATTWNNGSGAYRGRYIIIDGYSNSTSSSVSISRSIAFSRTDYRGRIAVVAKSLISTWTGYMYLDSIKVHQKYFDVLDAVQAGKNSATQNFIYVSTVKEQQETRFQRGVTTATTISPTATTFVSSPNLGAIPGPNNYSGVITTTSKYCLYGCVFAPSQVDSNLFYLAPMGYVNSATLSTFNLSTNLLSNDATSTVNHFDARSLSIFDTSATGEKVYMGNDGGISLKDNLGWHNLNGTGFNTSYAFGIGTSVHSGRITIGTGDNSMLTTKEANTSIWKREGGGDCPSIAYGKRYATRQLQLYSWSDNGFADNFDGLDAGVGLPTISFSGLFRVIRGHGLHKIKTTPYGEYAGGNQPTSCQFYKIGATLSGTNTTVTSSIIGGSSWPTSITGSGGRPKYYYNIAIAPDNGNPLYLAAFNHFSFWEAGLLSISIDGGLTWTNRTGLSGKHITDLCTDPRSSGSNKRLWACAGWYKCIGGDPTRGYERVFQSVDNGVTWTDYSDGLPENAVNAIVYDEQSRYLFAGTDMGVYARDVNSTTSKWRCYSLNLPNTFISALDINRCTGKIYASTLGRGAYSADLPQNWNMNGGTSDPYDVIEITTSRTFNQSIDIDKTIIIKPGGRLTIQGCTVSMARNKNIIVCKAAGTSPAGVLIVDNATITNSCGTLWGCINVEGIPSVSQDNTNPRSTTYPYSTRQGLVILKNNSVIENAFYGLFIGGQFYDGTDCPMYRTGDDGGMVLASNTTFRNCVNGAFFNNYTFPQYSKFTNCTFLADEPIHYPRYVQTGRGAPMPYGTVRGIFNIGTTGLEVKNCTFSNNLSSTFNPDIDLRGIGYEGREAEVKIEDCTFTNLTRGICVSQVASSAQASIVNNTLNNCWRAISMNNMNRPVCSLNTITLSAPATYMAGLTGMAIGGTFGEYNRRESMGIYLSKSDYHEIWNNNISSTDSNQVNYSIVVNATKNPASVNPSVAKIYRNHITNSCFGLSCLQDNRGLQIRCNKFKTISSAIIVDQGFLYTGATGISKGKLSDQGAAVGATILGAGNEFTVRDICPLSPVYHICSLYPNDANDFQYYGNVAGTATIGFMPYCNSTNVAMTTANVLPPLGFDYPCTDTLFFNFGDCCPKSSFPAPSRIGSTTNNEEISLNDAIESVANFNASIAAYNALIDEQRTPELLAMAENANMSGSALKDTLLHIDSALSDTVLMATIHRTSALSIEEMKEVVLRNAPLKHRVKDSLNLYYPDLALDPDILALDNTVSLSSKYELIKSSISLSKSEIIHCLMRYYVDSSNWDSLITMYSRERQFEVAFNFAMKGAKYQVAHTLLDSISYDTSLRNVLAIVLNQVENNKRIDSLSYDDSVKVADIFNTSPNSHAGELAKLLRLYNNHCAYYELMPTLDSTLLDSNFVPGPQNKKGNSIADTSGTISNHAIASLNVRAYPNPIKDELNLRLIGGVWEPGTVISIFDIYGRKMYVNLPSNTSNEVKIATNGWSSGVYIISIKLNSGDTHNLKVILQR